MANLFTNEELREMQGWSLEWKIKIAKEKIQEFYEAFDGNVYVSFSGGKDSTVLLDLVHQLYPDVPVVFSNTGLEYPEIQSFARSKGAKFIRPKMMFNEVLSVYGYPIISKEVSEAIYYARRILPRERERERDLPDSPPNVNGKLLHRRSSYKQTAKKRRELCGQRNDKDEYG